MAGLSKNFVDSTNIGEGDEAESPEMLMSVSFSSCLSPRNTQRVAEPSSLIVKLFVHGVGDDYSDIWVKYLIFQIEIFLILDMKHSIVVTHNDQVIVLLTGVAK